MGAYTGNAIASIACSEGVAVVDANVVRVIARLRRMAGDPRAAAKEHAALADMLLDPERPGCFNQVAPRCPCCGRRCIVPLCCIKRDFPLLALVANPCSVDKPLRRQGCFTDGLFTLPVQGVVTLYESKGSHLTNDGQCILPGHDLLVINSSNPTE